MSYTYLLEQGEESSAASFLDIPQHVLSRLNPIAEKCCCNDNATASCPSSQSGMMSAPSTDTLGEGKLMSFAGDFHAQTYPVPEPIAQSMASKWDLLDKAAVFGISIRESLVRLDLNVLLSKTLQISELKDLSASCKDLHPWGMMQNGVCLGLGISVQTTSESECGFSLPTPTSHNAKEGAYPAEFTRNTPTLSAQIGGKINPEWNEWRMAWPIGWTDLKPLVTGKTHLWRHSHGES